MYPIFKFTSIQKDIKPAKHTMRVVAIVSLFFSMAAAKTMKVCQTAHKNKWNRSMQGLVVPCLFSGHHGASKPDKGHFMMIRPNLKFILLQQ
jgi:hypothetical protein